MIKEYITKKSFNNLKHLKTSYHTESNLFTNEDKIYKFLKKEYLNREQTINELFKLKHNNIVTPLTTLYDRNGFLGYTMVYYKDYEELDKLLKQNINFIDRKNICILLCNIFKYMEDNNFAYQDIHEGNILYKDTDLKVIDIDSGIFKKPDNLEKYDSYLRASNYFLSNLILHILYLDSTNDLQRTLFKNKSLIYKTIPNNLIYFYDFLINKDGTFIDSLEFLDKIDEKIIDDSKNILKRSIN